MQSINRRKSNPLFNSALGLVQRKMANAIGCSAFLSLVLPAHALIFFSTGDPSYNTNAPRGALTNSGWQYQGAWSVFTGTVISSNAFITAKHVGGTIGDSFTFQGVQYTTTAAFESPDSDLRIWRV